MADWLWLSNAAVTRLHAVSALVYPSVAVCDPHLELATAVVSGDLPPRCKRCERVVGEES